MPAVVGIQQTNARKAAIIETLSLAIERGDVQLLRDPVLIAELQAYEMDRLPSGMMRYSAPEGMHDDCVIAAALGYMGVAGPTTGQAAWGSNPLAGYRG